MNNAVLKLSVWVGTFDSLSAVLQPVHAGDKNVLYTAIIQVRQYAESMTGTFLV